MLYLCLHSPTMLPSSTRIDKHLNMVSAVFFICNVILHVDVDIYLRKDNMMILDALKEDIDGGKTAKLAVWMNGIDTCVLYVKRVHGIYWLYSLSSLSEKPSVDGSWEWNKIVEKADYPIHQYEWASCTEDLPGALPYEIL